MSVKATNWAWEQKIPPYDKLVLVELADHADVDGICWPRQQLIADRTGIHRVTVNKIIQRLEVRGYLVQEHRRKHGGKQSSSLYRLPINEIVFQSSPALQDRVAEDYTTELPSATHIEEPSVESSNEPPIGADAQSEADMNVEDTLGKEKPTRDQIFAEAKRKDGKLTPDGCAAIWRRSRAANKAGGFQAELLGKHKNMLAGCYKRIKEVYPEVVWAVMENWLLFTKHAEKNEGAFNCPKTPTVEFFTKFIESAADFATQEDDDEDWGGVQLVAEKDLTKPKEKPQTKETSGKMTPEQLAKINKELGLL